MRVSKLLTLGLLVSSFWGCASTDSGESINEVDNFGENDYAGGEESWDDESWDDAPANSATTGGDNFENINNFSLQSFENNAFDSESLNNAEDEFTDAPVNNAFGMFNNETDSAMALNSVPSEFDAPLTDAFSDIPVDTTATLDAALPAAGQSANAVPTPTFATAPPGTGMVKYAAAKVQVYAAPNGMIVGTLEQGDHPLVFDESGWLKMSDGRFVELNSLTPNGVGRPRHDGIWDE